jgi:hypothetical protein
VTSSSKTERSFFGLAPTSTNKQNVDTNNLVTSSLPGAAGPKKEGNDEKYEKLR